MNYLKVKNKKIRATIRKFEHKKFILKIVNMNKFLALAIKYNLLSIKLKIKKNNSHVRITKRCILSNKKAIINKKFRISRYMFLKFARLNLIHGLKKNYW